jgi:capsular polysaccharide export protein
MAKKAGHHAYLIKRQKNIQHNVNFNQEKILEIEMNDISREGAEYAASQIWCNLESVYLKYLPKIMFIYNGTTIFTLTAGKFAKKNSILTAFFELANIKGKMFVDPEGTNGHSLLYKKPHILDTFDYSPDKFV